LTCYLGISETGERQKIVTYRGYTPYIGISLSGSLSARAERHGALPYTVSTSPLCLECYLFQPENKPISIHFPDSKQEKE